MIPRSKTVSSPLARPVRIIVRKPGCMSPVRHEAKRLIPWTLERVIIRITVICPPRHDLISLTSTPVPLVIWVAYTGVERAQVDGTSLLLSPRIVGPLSHPAYHTDGGWSIHVCRIFCKGIKMHHCKLGNHGSYLTCEVDTT